MLRSMYSGISGMKGFQTKLDVIGTNIANVNTAGFKKGRVTFQDMMSQTIAGTQQGVAGQRGGINPSQVGAGSQVGSIDNVDTQGNRQTTNRPLDLSLEGNGMFVLGEGMEDLENIQLADSNISFTRSGNFYLDSQGAIVSSDGLYLIGQGANDAGTALANGNNASTITIPQDAQSFSIQGNGEVTYISDEGDTLLAGQIRLANFSNPGGLQKSGSNTFQLTENAGLLEENEVFDINALTIPQLGGAGGIVSGSLEMSNVDLAEEFTEMITAQRGFQANTRIITTSDEILQELVNLKR